MGHFLIKRRDFHPPFWLKQQAWEVAPRESRKCPHESWEMTGALDWNNYSTGPILHRVNPYFYRCWRARLGQVLSLVVSKSLNNMRLDTEPKKGVPVCTGMQAPRGRVCVAPWGGLSSWVSACWIHSPAVRPPPASLSPRVWSEGLGCALSSF